MVAILFIVLNVLNDYPVGPTIVLALLVTGLAYLAGDIGVLPWSNNTVATVADFGLSLLTVWLIGPYIVGADIPFSIALLIGLLTAAGEWFFHKYMAGTVLADRESPETT